MSDKDTLDTLLENTTPTLSDGERALLWQHIEAGVSVGVPVRSPYFSFLRMHTMTPLAIALIVLLGTGTTVAASDLAKPGDLLFPIERAVERTQLALVSDERAAELRSTFTKERLSELEAIITEEAKDTITEDGRATPTVLVSETGEVRISKAVNELLDLVEEVDDEAARDEYLETLLSRIDTVAVHGREKGRVRSDDKRFEVRTEDSRVQIDDERVEVREDGYRIRIDKDGEVRVKQDKSQGGKGRDDDDAAWDDLEYSDDEDEYEDEREDEESEYEDEEYEDDGRRRGHDEDDYEGDDEDDNRSEPGDDSEDEDEDRSGHNDEDEDDDEEDEQEDEDESRDEDNN